MKLATLPAANTAPAACPPGSVSGARSPRSGAGPGHRSGVPVPDGPDDEAQKRAIANAVWTDLLWLMPPGRTVTVTVRDGRVAVELDPPGPMPETAAH